jgi:hypothetical protein
VIALVEVVRSAAQSLNTPTDAPRAGFTVKTRVGDGGVRSNGGQGFPGRFHVRHTMIYKFKSKAAADLHDDRRRSAIAC